MLRFGIFLGIIGITILGCFLPQFALYPAAVSPFVAVTALLGGQVTAALFVALFLVTPSVFKRRFFCLTLCPLGFCFRTVEKARKKVDGSSRLMLFFQSFPKIGVFLALLTLFGSVVGAVGFLWLDPLVLFASLLRSGIWLLPVLGGVFALSWLAPTFWCRAICPLGGLQDILYVPKSLFSKPKSVVRLEKRRRLLHQGIWIILFSGIFEFLRCRTSANVVNAPLRPPGAVSEPFFLALCTRCGTCVQVCPTKLLTTSSESTSVLDYGTPHLCFDPAWCRDDCTACTQSCPSGALRRIELAAKKNVKIGLVSFTFEFCRLYEDIECSACGRDCPFEAISYQWSEEEYRRIVRINPETCTGCGRCIVSCPVKGQERPLQI